ncbi:leucine carboxyl methyltransferase [Purpureocillium lavendulum]|uniref:tRNA wybutosine-synthesizing protein 4 n=1 Tax=Purpureocillium lavendulum TaxID=1247861 RepID=A0AB34FN81_9HYPO|nr:leucine carboxyl methyltransferase [Purpureocillium lavendulum]
MEPATASKIAPAVAGSRALDDLIMGSDEAKEMATKTNSSSIMSKRSVERLYYPDETHFFRYFVRKFQRRAPLINRGYWLRLRAIDVVVRKFLTCPSSRKKLVINLGCGSDVLPWQSYARYNAACENVLFIDIDYPDLMQKKRAVVLETPELKALLGEHYIVGESDILLRSRRYCQIGCDLRQLQQLRATLETFLPLDDCDVLFVAEVSITYMDTASADSLLQWASTVGKVRQYPTIESQRRRFLDRGWADVAIWDLWQVWSDDYFVTSTERSALDRVEPFDEWEEFILFARHYFIIHALGPGVNLERPEWTLARAAAPQNQSPERSHIDVTAHCEKSPKRRYGEAIIASNSRGEQSLLHMGGLGSNGRADSCDIYALGRHTELEHLPPTIEFDPVPDQQRLRLNVALFGAKCVNFGSGWLLCGGLGQEASFLGGDFVFIDNDGSGLRTAQVLRPNDQSAAFPFMVGCAAVASPRGVLIIGGGATCFSMGTFWEAGVYSIKIPPRSCVQIDDHSRALSATTIEHIATSRIVSSGVAGKQAPAHSEKATAIQVPRVRLGTDNAFKDVLMDAKPVIIEGLHMGKCVKTWTPQYMAEQVGEQTEVVVHESHRDSEKMDFNSKNFDYVSDHFGKIIAQMESGARMYLRSLSRDKPSEAPANLELDFPRLAQDFCLPPELEYIRDNFFSSVLRVSGRVNMWLHYDVMANVYTQISGAKRMILFPPSDVANLAFAPGASSSSIDVFKALDAKTRTPDDTPGLAGTHPHEAILGPGDVLFLPALWLHAATPLSNMSVAVNTFFRDLESGYAAGRDVYGNRDLAAYEKARLDAARMAKSFQQLPLETRRFYLSRIADELRQAAEGA